MFPPPRPPTMRTAGALSASKQEVNLLLGYSFSRFTNLALLFLPLTANPCGKSTRFPSHTSMGCHLLTYEQQLPSLVLSHCHYSLAVGRGQDISYDLPALEKQLLDRFIHGKPLILSDIPQVAYRKDIYTAATFAGIAAVRKNVTQVCSQKLIAGTSWELRT